MGELVMIWMCVSAKGSTAKLAEEVIRKCAEEAIHMLTQPVVEVEIRSERRRLVQALVHQECMAYDSETPQAGKEHHAQLLLTLYHRSHLVEVVFSHDEQLAQEPVGLRDCMP